MKAKSRESREQMMSAQVILRMRDSHQPVTAKTIRSVAPDLQAVQKAMHWFDAHGFQVGEFVGTSFSITASRDHFKKVLGAKAASGKKAAGLPMDGVDPSIRTLIEAIAVTPPPDFGPPGGYA